jgi:putative RNA 2'-phosphotransferase
MQNKSKYLALLLRHNPDAGPIVVDPFGWADVKEVLSVLNMTSSDLIRLVNGDDKQRYAFSKDMTRIRANQGHSIDVLIDMEVYVPTEGEVFYHGTVNRAVKTILLEGLKPMSRQFVHMTKDRDLALKTGSRRGEPVLLQIDAFGLRERGIEILRSQNDVFQTKSVPREIISVVS